jgi:hypothetical protein
MRTALFLFCGVLATGWVCAADSNPRVTGILDQFDTTVVKSDLEYQTAVTKAAKKRSDTLGRARITALKALKRMVTTRTDAALSAEIYRAVLSLDLNDPDARQFFEDDGSLEAVLATLERRVEEDLLGNAVAVSPSAAQDFEPAQEQMVAARQGSVFGAFASSSPQGVHGHVLANAFDGQDSTRWAGAARSGEWVMASFRRPVNIATIRIHWEVAFATTYTISVRVRGVWREVNVRDGRVGWIEHPMQVEGVTAIRIGDMEAGDQWPPSIWEVVVE